MVSVVNCTKHYRKENTNSIQTSQKYLKWRAYFPEAMMLALWGYQNQAQTLQENFKMIDAKKPEQNFSKSNSTIC